MRLSAYLPTRTFELTVRMERGERTTLSQCSAISVNPSSARREFVGSGTTPLRLTRHVTRAELPCGRVWKWAVSEVRK